MKTQSKNTKIVEDQNVSVLHLWEFSGRRREIKKPVGFALLRGVTGIGTFMVTVHRLLVDDNRKFSKHV